MKYKYTSRARIKKEIVSEFVQPTKPSNKVIILCSGMPNYPAKSELMFFLAEKGYWVFLPRYRGSWESDGSFLQKSPHLDIIDVMDELSSGFQNIYSNKKHAIQEPEIYLIGSSFGGPATILASSDKRVKRVVALSPVIDWRVESKAEPIDWIHKFTKMAYGNGYRFKENDWNKLKNGKFYNPISAISKLDRNKIYIIQAKDDEVVYPEPAIKFSRELGSKLTLLEEGGHLSLSSLAKDDVWKGVGDHLRSN